MTQLLTLTKTQKFPPQKFAWSNNYFNVRTMNEFRFIFFFFYILDMRNKAIEGNILLINPSSNERITSIIADT